VGKVLSFKPQIGKVKTGQTTGEFTVISPRIEEKEGSLSHCRQV